MEEGNTNLSNDSDVSNGWSLIGNSDNSSDADSVEVLSSEGIHSENLDDYEIVNDPLNLIKSTNSMEDNFKNFKPLFQSPPPIYSTDDVLTSSTIDDDFELISKHEIKKSSSSVSTWGKIQKYKNKFLDDPLYYIYCILLFVPITLIGYYLYTSGLRDIFPRNYNAEYLPQDVKCNNYYPETKNLAELVRFLNTKVAYLRRYQSKLLFKQNTYYSENQILKAEIEKLNRVISGLISDREDFHNSVIVQQRNILENTIENLTLSIDENIPNYLPCNDLLVSNLTKSKEKIKNIIKSHALNNNEDFVQTNNFVYFELFKKINDSMLMLENLNKNLTEVVDILNVDLIKKFNLKQQKIYDDVIDEVSIMSANVEKKVNNLADRLEKKLLKSICSNNKMQKNNLSKEEIEKYRVKCTDYNKKEINNKDSLLRNLKKKKIEKIYGARKLNKIVEKIEIPISPDRCHKQIFDKFLNFKKIKKEKLNRLMIKYIKSQRTKKDKLCDKKENSNRFDNDNGSISIDQIIYDSSNEASWFFDMAEIRAKLRTNKKKDFYRNSDKINRKHDFFS